MEMTKGRGDVGKVGENQEKIVMQGSIGAMVPSAVEMAGLGF
jgi:hypothetical protein